jgi:hypothetical protein
MNVIKENEGGRLLCLRLNKVCQKRSDQVRLFKIPGLGGRIRKDYSGSGSDKSSKCFGSERKLGARDQCEGRYETLQFEPAGMLRGGGR